MQLSTYFPVCVCVNKIHFKCTSISLCCFANVTQHFGIIPFKDLTSEAKELQQSKDYRKTFADERRLLWSQKARVYHYSCKIVRLNKLSMICWINSFLTCLNNICLVMCERVVEDFQRDFRLSEIRLFVELAGELRGLADTTPAEFFAPWSQLPEVFPACWTCKGKREAQKRAGRGERTYDTAERVGKGRRRSVKQRWGWWGETHLVCRLLLLQPLGRIFFLLLL